MINPDEGDSEPIGGGEEESDMPMADASSYAKAGRTIRHAITDGDDEALAHAICDLIDIHESDEPDEGAPAKGKPSLAAILLSKKKD